MGLSNFLRRVNRGIALGLALVVGLTCYLIIDNVAFNGEREVIRRILEDYISDMSGFTILPEQYTEIGSEVPESVIVDKMKENGVLIDKYFSNINYRDIGSAKFSISQSLEQILYSNGKSGNKVKSCDAKLTRVKSIRKHGANLVTVEAVADLTIVRTLGAEALNVFYAAPFYGGGDIPAELTEPANMAFTIHNYESSFTCEMTKSNGVWKFSYVGNISITVR
ncbi:MAG: hypothetical protein LBI36_07480 [Oscillospiraceae bacterium]|jgi:hypothetical protein|nr:hypothetical protein [Oscillospiraceae bacterium]